MEIVAGHIQNGGLCDEDAGGREHPREAHRQDLPPDGPQQGRQTEPGGVHRGRQERPLDRAAAAVRPAGAVVAHRFAPQPPQRLVLSS